MLGLMRLASRAGRLTVGAAAGFLSSMAWGACTVESSSSGPMLVPHCVDEAGNATCQQNQPGRPYCNTCKPASENQGCSDQPPPPACQVGGTATSFTSGSDESSTSDGSTTMSSSPTTSITGADTGTGTDAATTGPGPACASDDGTLDPDCESADASRPYCVDQTCVGCVGAGGDDFCGELEPGNAPACDGDSGLCVTCIDAPEAFSCGGNTPVCDASGACMACDAHEDCPDTACHLDPVDPAYGSCFELSEVVWVDNGEICPGQGTMADPNCSLAQAVSNVTAGENVVIRLAGTGTPYTENVVFAEDAVVAIIGEDGPTLSGVPGVNSPSIALQAGIVYLGKVRINDNDRTHGLDCDGARVWLRNGEARGNDGYGVYSSGPCDLVISRSSIHHNLGGGVRALGGKAAIDNTAIALNGDGSRGPGLNLQFAEVDLVYDTIVGNAAPGTADNIACLDVTGVVRNSIVVGTGLASIDLDCFTLDYDYNAIDTNGFTGPEGKLIGDPYDAGWFQNPAVGDFRLQSPDLTPFGDVALWQEGDPPFDADGTPRPQGGELGYAGVDQP